MEVSFDDTAADRRVLEQLLAGEEPKITMAGTIPVRDVQPDGSVSTIMYLYPPDPEPEDSPEL
jgi:hypothetical protein